MPPSARPIRILRIIARLNIGGPAIQVVNLTRQFSENDYESLLVTGTVGPREGDMGYLARKLGIAPVYLPELGRSLSPLKDLKAFLKLRKIARRFRPHILHTHTAKAGTLGRLAAMSAGRKIATVHTFHGHVFSGYFSPWKSMLFLLIERVLGRLTDRIVVISHEQHREICRTHRVAPKEKVRIVPLGFDLSPFLAISKQRDTKARKKLLGARREDDAFWIGCIGRLTAIKNHQLLIDAIHSLKNQNRLGRIRVAIIGGGELEGSLKKSVSASGLQDRIRFYGWQKDMPSVYSALDAVVLTSRNEGTPVTLIEAMAAGKPVIGTLVGGVPDLMGPIVDNRPDRSFSIAERGLAVGSNDADAVAEAIEYLSANPPVVEKMIDASRAWVSKHYSMERLVEDLRALYLDVVSESGGR